MIVSRRVTVRTTIRQIGDVSVIDLSGRITIGEGGVMLREQVRELLESHQRHIVLNLRHVPYMDSAGILEMVNCHKLAKERGGAVKLLQPTEKVRDVLQITRFDDVFETYQDERDAIASF